MKKPYITTRDRIFKNKDWFTSYRNNKNIRMLTEEEAEKLEDIVCIDKNFDYIKGLPTTVKECKKYYRSNFTINAEPRKKNSYTWGLRGSSLLDYRNELEAWWALLDWAESKGYCKLNK